MFGERKTLHSHSLKKLKHGGSIMVWHCFAESGPGLLAIIDGTMNSECSNF